MYMITHRRWSFFPIAYIWTTPCALRAPHTYHMAETIYKSGTNSSTRSKPWRCWIYQYGNYTKNKNSFS